jgi:hypothetical protein
MQINTEQTRQTYGCGWAPIPSARLLPWVKVPTPLKFEPTRDRDGKALVEVCPGYLVRLPQVVEAVEARFWKHDLRTWCDGQPTPELMLAVQILEGSVNEVEHAKMTKREQGGLAD